MPISRPNIPGILLATALGLVAASAAPASAQEAAAATGSAPGLVPGLVSASAEASRRLPATVSDAAVTIEVQGRDLRTTAAQLAQRSRGLLDYLGAQGAERLRTEGIGFEPELQEVRSGPSRIKGYSGRATVSFRTVPDRLPALLAGSLENGANGVVQSGSSPREEEVEAARRELAAEATRAAMARVRAVAEAAEARLDGIHRLELDPARTGGRPDYAPAMAMRMERPAAVPPIAVAAGETEVSVRVSLTMRVAPRG